MTRHRDQPRAAADTRRAGALWAAIVAASTLIATTEDPAPHGSLLYAIQVDDRTCVIGYLNRVPLGMSGPSTSRKSSGRCPGPVTATP